MKTLFYILLAVGLNSQVYGQTVWKVQSANVSFRIKNAGIGVDGKFTGFSGNLKFDSQNLKDSYLEATLDVKTLDTGIGLRDGHLKKEEYFFAEKYPQITMKSLKLESKGGNNYSGTFYLTIKNVTKAINFPFTFVETNGIAIFKGNFKIDRREYKIGSNHLTLGNEVTVNLEVKTTK